MSPTIPYIKRAVSLFPSVGVRITLFMISFSVLTQIPNIFFQILIQQHIAYYVLFLPYMLFSIILWIYISAVTIIMLQTHLRDEFLPLTAVLKAAWDVLPSLLYAWLVPILQIAVGFVLCYVPGIYLWFRYHFVSYEVILGGVEPSEAGKRSAEDTNGWKMQLLLLTVALNMLPAFLLMALFIMAIGFAEFAAMSQSINLTYVVYTLGFSLLLMPLYAINLMTGLLIYLDIFTWRQQAEEIPEYEMDGLTDQD